jgi:hypothetical protein
LKPVFLFEIFEFRSVCQIKALRKKSVDFYIIPPNEVFEGVTQPDFGRDHVVFHEVICNLEVLELCGVVRFYREFKIKNRRLLVRVLKPTPLNQGFSQSAVTSSDNENLDVRGEAVFFSEDTEIDNGLFLLFGFVSC